MSLLQEIKRLQEEEKIFQESRSLCKQLIYRMDDTSGINKIITTTNEAELKDEFFALIKVKLDKYDNIIEEIRESIKQIESKILEQKNNKDQKKLKAVNPNYIAIKGKIPFHQVGVTHEANKEILLYKDNKFLGWDGGSSGYVGRTTGVVYSSSRLLLIDAPHMEAVKYGEKISYIKYGKHRRYTGDPKSISLESNGKFSKKLIQDNLEVIRDFFNEPNLQVTDIVRGFMVCLSDVEDMKKIE